MAINFGLGSSVDPRAPSNPDTGETEEILTRSLRLFEELRDDVARAAKRISDEMIEQLLLPARSLSFASFRRLPLHMADVEDNLDKLKGQVRFQQQYGLTDMPCVPVGDVLIPVSTEEVWRRQHDGSRKPGDTGPTESREAMESFRPLSIERALSNVGQHLSPFIADRMAASRYFAIGGFTGGMSGSPHMLSVVVHSLTVGARVSYSPAYFVNYIALAAPTTPVQGMLDPGRYIFMLTAPGSVRLTDSQVFDVPPTFSISLTV
ncbi:MAG: hypothetical protein IE917_14020 [Betaproteobacteria bacterium]|nr:hypothetical protein [Betaproteobacteria bacterium]